MPETRKTCTGLIYTDNAGNRTYSNGPAGNKTDPDWKSCTDTAEYSWKPYLLDAPYLLCVRHVAESAANSRDNTVERLA